MTKPLHFACVFGTRPEAIKMAPLVRRLRDTAGIRTSVITTGQHREMLDQVLQFFHITPDIRLDAMQAGQSISKLMSRLLADLDVALGSLEPSVVLVHGDTMTTLAAAMSSFYGGFPVAHVEAGLRTSNLLSPWPEESNRRLTSVLTRFHFAPTEQAKAALLAEGHAPDQIWVTGNTVIDALLDAIALIDGDPARRRQLQDALPVPDGQRRLILVTGHRRENFDGGLAALCEALARIARRGDVEIVFPIHLNPVVQDVVRGRLSGDPAIHLLPPLDYPTFVTAMRSAHLILTDSGGIQEEAPSLGKPVLVLRDTTERPEGIRAGTVRLIGTNTDTVVAETTRLLDDQRHYEAMATAHNPYGDGKASMRIVEALQAQLAAAN
ncbi:MAG: UDP-N-acetyl glucosamine 2-epimerase [Gammaproteobacteria bacterium]|nr:MAG: UDP-N-acetylglucosamine 2-epimerase (non-hydrolyzing) [Pseudomonadota bacterium]MBC6945063.1 UDP-N-acetylglucosamine 2-epimerase (non-hydrolyzing) [Gammaproteobacteria bacterium]MCE7896957.1 UDP-N-acetylglucosamine 2-epimerase (non-hydrolyzing) [Gammaproteobacteria bacterium PRO8]MDL1879776.1 UDP-N-acetylglucosamine 2-epimerase (non-hydrolyzing) [Gammaproteobacteria bacterium PRO2]MCL4776969.1 UDP-N-acetylglucosamine 2-epimerase (non-hydrolyzing) [Gammaproteobacteria bacterium]